MAAAQSVLFWLDGAQSMQFASKGAMQTKIDRAKLISLAAAVLLIRGGERVGMTGLSMPPRSGELQLLRLTQMLADAGDDTDYGTPDIKGMVSHSRAVFVSDFLGDIAPVRAALTEAADKGVKGALLQVLDPEEEAFPFDGRTIFESIGGTVRHETLKAGDLRDRYLTRLATRKAELAELARVTGWQYHCHHTDAAASQALLWLYGALERTT